MQQGRLRRDASSSDLFLGVTSGISQSGSSPPVPESIMYLFLASVMMNKRSPGKMHLDTDPLALERTACFQACPFK